MNPSIHHRAIRLRYFAFGMIALLAAGCAGGKLHDVPKLFALPEGEERLLKTESGAVCRVHPVRIVDRTQYDVDRRLGNIVKEMRRDGWITYITAEYTELELTEPGKQAGVWTYDRCKVKVDEPPRARIH